jgi:hypothetical protein
MWFELGPTAAVPYFNWMPVYIYALISVILMLVFLGGTAHMLVSELSIKDDVRKISERAIRLENSQQAQEKVLESVKARVFLVDESLERTRAELSKGLVDQGDAIKQSMEMGHQAQKKMLDGVQGRVFLLDESLKDVKKGLSEQTDVTKLVNANLVAKVDKVGPQLADVKEALAQLEKGDKKTVAAITKQMDEIEELKLKVERLEDALVTPKPLLTSQSDVEIVKGIGPGKGAELKEIGITSVGDLIMADPKVIVDKTGSTDKTVEKWQGRAQLSMIPGLKDKDLLLLEDLDIIDRKSLADQDPIELSKKLNAIFKVNLAKGKVSEADKPTIEEIDSWVRSAKY